MHFEVPKSKFASVREFFGEYAMIVVSILTALALEFTVEQWHHAHRAAEARANMDAEIKANLLNIRAVRQANKETSKLLEQLFDSLSSDILAGLPDAQIVDHFKKQADGRFGMQFRMPEPVHDAFDTAVASQAASWIAQDAFLHYSRVYTRQRGLVSDLDQHTAVLLDGPQVLNARTDLMLGSVKPRELLYAVQRMLVLHQIVDGHLEAVDKQVDKEFPALLPAT